MIRIVTPDLYHLNRHELRAMHRLRYRVFKERLGWDVQTKNGEERDEFDDLDPVYILAFDRHHGLVGSWRLLPTTGPNMLRDVFSDLLGEHPMPDDPHIWELSRFSVDCGPNTDFEDAANLTVINLATHELFCGLAEYGMAVGIRQVVSVYDIRIARLLPRMGCQPKWRTRPQRVGKTSALAGLFDVNEAGLDSVRAAAGIQGSVIEVPYGIAGSRAA